MTASRSRWRASGADWDRWLDPAIDDPAKLEDLLVPADDGLLEAYPISRLVNDVRNNGPQLLEPIGPPAEPEPEQGRLGLAG
jgi:putative SOS response-associated peptidase YedK